MSPDMAMWHGEGAATKASGRSSPAAGEPDPVDLVDPRRRVHHDAARRAAAARRCAVGKVITRPCEPSRAL
jgi:hypothetical protein